MKTELEDRTLQFAIRIVKFVGTLPSGDAGWVVARQSMKSGTSIGANYREAGRAESKDDFIHKAGIAEKEAAETEYWLLICERSFAVSPELTALLDESRQLIGILTTIGRKAKRGS